MSEYFEENKKLLNDMINVEINCGLGWYGIIFPIFAELKKYNDKHKDKPFKIEYITYYEGVLSVITDNKCPKKIQTVIEKAEKASYTICELCGCEGFLRLSRGIVPMVLCNECEEKFRNDAKKEYKYNDFQYEKSLIKNVAFYNRPLDAREKDAKYGFMSIGLKIF